MNWTTASVALIGALAIMSTHDGLARADATSEPANVIRIDQRYVRAAYSNCQYVGSIQGDITVLPRSDSGSARYRSDVTVDGRVTCAGGFEERFEPRRVVGENQTRGQIERALEEAGRIHLRRGVHVCTITPDFDWHDGTVRPASNFSQFCRYARGGGPRYHWFYSY